jgi:hypothetical protein
VANGLRVGPRAGAGLLIALGVLLLTLAAGRAWVRSASRHVIVEAQTVNDEEQIFVNCRAPFLVDSSIEPERFDLGWLQPDDKISLAVLNLRGDDTSVRFVGHSNGEEIFNYDRGGAAAAALPARPGFWAFEETYTADGDPIRDSGCQQKVFVAPDLVDYSPLVDDLAAPGEQPSGAGGRPNWWYDRIDTLGATAPAVLATLGAVAALIFGLALWQRVGGANREKLGIALTVLGLVYALIIEKGLTTTGILLYLTSVAGAVIWASRSYRLARSEDRQAS